MTLGRFITVEGGEGVGKSTQCRHILELLQAFKIEAILTREPGGSDGADQLRELLVTGSEDRWDPMSETLLLFAARRDHQRRTITPALEAGVWVISDRFNDSTLAYQGFGHGIDLRFLKSLGKRVSGDLRPDLTFMLDAPSTVGIARALGRGGIEDRYERLLGEFHEKAREGFLKIAKGEPDRCRIIDATKPVEAVRAEISAGIIERFNFEDRKSSAQSIQSLSSPAL